MTAKAALARVRRVALALPDVSERLSHGAPTFFVGKRSFLMLWCAAPGEAYDVVSAR